MSMSSSTELILLSPRGLNSRSRSRLKAKTNNKGRVVGQSGVIELTDSDSEQDVVVPVKKTRKLNGASLGDSSDQTIQLVESSSGSINNAAGTSTANAKHGPAPLPLFLPDDEEALPPEHILDTPPIPPNPPQDRSAALSPDRDADHASQHLETVLELVPDVDPQHATALIAERLLTRPESDVVTAVIEALFDSGSYPKIDRKGKRKNMESDEDQRKKARLDQPDYASVDREHKGGLHYTDLAIEQLATDFPDVPKPYIRKLFLSQKTLYAPTHLHLAAEKARGPPYSYIPKKVLSKSKGKQKVLEDAEYQKERDWLVRKLDEQEIENNAPAKGINLQANEDACDGIECGCCFSAYSFGSMIQCEDGHLFCTECMTSYAENLLGSHNVNIVCMDQSGCKHPFPESELRRFLSAKLMSLYERVKQTKEIEMAGLEGLEECPFCDFKCVIENPEEKLFRCGDVEECGAITCRQCKKPDHLPRSCKEMEEDRVLNGRHIIEEAMTHALMRNCPQCQKSFIKEDGCNKMTCPNCHTLSCYVCRKVITGYDHFNQRPGTPGKGAISRKCPLYDQTADRHALEVRQAAENAMKEYKRDNPDVDEKDIRVDSSVAPKAPQQLPGMPWPNHYAGPLRVFR